MYFVLKTVKTEKWKCTIFITRKSFTILSQMKIINLAHSQPENNVLSYKKAKIKKEKLLLFTTKVGKEVYLRS